MQCALLSVSVASIWVQNSRVASIMLISGVAASRLGLWMFDLSVTQLMQVDSLKPKSLHFGPSLCFQLEAVTVSVGCAIQDGLEY